MNLPEWWKVDIFLPYRVIGLRASFFEVWSAGHDDGKVRFEERSGVSEVRPPSRVALLDQTVKYT
jgi:hypothetical protein